MLIKTIRLLIRNGAKNYGQRVGKLYKIRVSHNNGGYEDCYLEGYNAVSDEQNSACHFLSRWYRVRLIHRA
jgi:hypothetical protein